MVEVILVGDIEEEECRPRSMTVGKLFYGGGVSGGRY